ncbi:hypothetical protein HQ41_03390 [Porphyromonas sp. COT-290 OH860]|nr:hypothetical protein HQ41_03390 [Porphyromonas sp. COT-290 OH860]
MLGSYKPRKGTDILSTLTLGYKKGLWQKLICPQPLSFILVLGLLQGQGKTLLKHPILGASAPIIVCICTQYKVQYDAFSFRKIALEETQSA